MTQGPMEWEYFKFYKCMFLPVGIKQSAISDFKRLGGIKQKYVDESTDFIVAKTWEEVADHFSPYPGLMSHYTSAGVSIVEYNWLTDCLESGCLIDEDLYKLKSVPGYLQTESFFVDRQLTLPTTRTYFKSVVRQYRGGVALAMGKILEESKNKRRRACK